jgi:ABC-2 type transport system ATP-binding protein
MGRYPHRPALALESPADEALAREAMRRCDVDHLAARRFDELSGGERRRALLAQAFCQAADLILLDEPTASLDPDTADWVRTHLERYRERRGASILLASHNMSEVERLCDRVIMMKLGQIVDDDTPEGLLARYGRSTLEEVFLDVARNRRQPVDEPAKKAAS